MTRPLLIVGFATSENDATFSHFGNDLLLHETINWNILKELNRHLKLKKKVIFFFYLKHIAMSAMPMMRYMEQKMRLNSTPLEPEPPMSESPGTKSPNPVVDRLMKQK